MDGCHQCFHDCLARAVTLDPDNPPFGMGGFPGRGQLALKIPVKRHAVFEQVVQALRCVSRHEAGDFPVHDAGTCGNRVGHVFLDRVTRHDGGRNAGLSPCRGRTLSNRRSGQHRHRSWSEFQRAEQPGQAAADDDNIIDTVG